MKNTKRALFLSVVSMFLCVVMLASTTFAWFTDSVESTGNIVKTGTLKVDLLNDGVSLKANTTHKIFDYSLWEPGYTQVEGLKLENHGNLHFKYQLAIVPNGAVSALANVIDVYVVDGAVSGRPTAGKVGTLASVLNAGGVLISGNTADLTLTDGAVVFDKTVALKMQESAGNEYQNMSLVDGGFSVRLLATQLTKESDSFNDQYDADSQYPVLVATETELVEALGASKNVVLKNDIALTDDTTVLLTSGTESVLDLNGHTLSGENTRTATHNLLIDVNGATLDIKNGTVEMTHTGTNMAWNGAATIIDVTNNGVLNLSNVTLKNNGGTDMNFAVHLNNWGEATLIADNCTFEAPYCAVRVFNSGPAMNNVKITNSTLKGGNVAFWVHNYTSADFGGKLHSGSSASYDEAAVKARLNFDIFNNTNTFEKGAASTRKSAIRYGMTDSVYYDANGNLVA